MIFVRIFFSERLLSKSFALKIKRRKEKFAARAVSLYLSASVKLLKNFARFVRRKNEVC